MARLHFTDDTAGQLLYFIQRDGGNDKEVEAAGGPTTSTLYNIRHKGSRTIYGSTIRKIEDACGWAKGSVQNIADGGTPVRIGYEDEDTPGAEPSGSPESEPDAPECAAELPIGTEPDPRIRQDLIEEIATCLRHEYRGYQPNWSRDMWRIADGKEINEDGDTETQAAIRRLYEFVGGSMGLLMREALTRAHEQQQRHTGDNPVG